MKNTIFWIALAALSLQDLFKKSAPIKPTKRQQQFLQTGETAQAFIEGISNRKKYLSYYFGKPKKTKNNTYYEATYTRYRWVVKDYFFLDLETVNDYNSLILRNIDESIEISRDISSFDDEMYAVEKVLTYLLFLLAASSKDERYKKIADIAEAGDLQLALEIAKGQGLI
jgi:hypothetical protein